MSNPVVLIHLRQPRKSCPKEMRSDPFWEFGSFGITGCHYHDIMHPKNRSGVMEAQLAFAQGGYGKIRLVNLTPPISEVIVYADRLEARWTPMSMPFRFDCAPLLIDNDGNTDVTSLKKIIREVNRSTWCGKFSSKFRRRKRPAPAITALEIRKAYRTARDSSREDAIASNYIDALPYPPPTIDKDRKKTYNRLLKKLGMPSSRSCR